MADHENGTRGRDDREDRTRSGAEAAFVERITEVLRRPEVLDPTFKARLMAAVLAEPAEGGSHGTAAATLKVLRDVAGEAEDEALPDARPAARPRRRFLGYSATTWVAAATGVAALAAAVVLMVLPLRTPAGPAEPATLPAASTPVGKGASVAEGRLVRFALVALGASSVTVVGDFNDWEPEATPLAPVADGGVWTVDLALDPGRHEYAFMVDGERWVLDPAAPVSVGEDFGRPNSVVTIGERTT